MGFRTIIIKNRAKLEHRLNSLVIRADEEKKIYLGEINTLIIQSTAVSLTASLLNELTKNNVKVIFCDEKCNPSAELLPYYGAHNTSKRYKEQFAWSEYLKGEVWKLVIKRKIQMQAQLLAERNFCEQSEMLVAYAKTVESGDITNREGHSAKVYFNSILEGFSRNDDTFYNACINYGYAILLSAFNREIVASGYLTQIGIWHNNEFNEFNLACDLMEPLRPIVDKTAFYIELGDASFKRKMINVLNYKTKIAGKETTLDLAIRTYVKSVFNALREEDISLITFIEDVEVTVE